MTQDQHDYSIVRLRRISAEMDRLADELQSLDLPQSGISGPAARVRRYIKQRRRRETLFMAGLFADPAWDILLDLYASSLEGRDVTVSDACIAASVPPTTALRYVKKLTKDGLICRIDAENDGRKVYLKLGVDAHQAIASWVSETLGLIAI